MANDIRVFLPQRQKDKWFSSSTILNGVVFTDKPSEADIQINTSDWNSESSCFTNHEKQIYLMSYISSGSKNNKQFTRARIRHGFCVDDKIKGLPQPINFCFSHNDFCKNPYLITVPVGFNPPNGISQKPEYWKEKQKTQNIQYHGKLYWKGNSKNHFTRKTVLEYYENRDSRFNVSDFSDSVYRAPCKAQVYENYIQKLLNADMSFCLRGDRPSTHSFFDLLQHGCIPVNINCMDLGWSNILSDVSSYMLFYDLTKQTLDEIHSDIIRILEDKDRVLKMKHNCVNLFETLFKNQTRSAWGEFLLAKCIEIHKNDYDINKISNTLISSEYLQLKGFNQKL